MKITLMSLKQQVPEWKAEGERMDCPISVPCGIGSNITSVLTLFCKHLRKLLVGGSIITEPLNILSEQKRFYQDLYRTKTETVEINNFINEFLNKLGIPKLSEEQKQMCEGKMSIQECENVSDSFQTNKSPGNDGIPIEFYKRCWKISQPFLESVNESFEKGEMSNSQKQAVITLIERKGRDRCFIENWRPISVLNVDAKIASKVIATRIRKALPNIIHHNQSGYISDRYLGETVRSIFDIMDLPDKENISGLLIIY